MTDRSERGDPRVSYRISEDADQVRQERDRLHALARTRDPFTRRILLDLGLGAGWRCADVGCGVGTVARWMAEQVGAGGRVVAIDLDARFQPVPGGGLEVRQADVTVEAIGDAEFDLVLARALLQHLHQREDVLDSMVAAAAPGGWVVVADSDWVQFEAQPIPEPFATLSRLTRRASETRTGHDPTLARRLVPMLQARGLRDVGARGEIWTMHGGTDSAEWYVAGLARTIDENRRTGTLPADFPAEEAIAQARHPDFAVLSPISVTAWGRRV